VSNTFALILTCFVLSTLGYEKQLTTFIAGHNWFIVSMLVVASIMDFIRK